MSSQTAQPNAKSDRVPSRLTGLLLLSNAIAFNKWSLERLFSADQYIYSLASVVAIALLQLVVASIGLWFILRRPTGIFGSGANRAVVFGLVAVLFFGLYGNLRALHIIDPDRELRQAWQEMSTGEELLIDLTIPLKKTLSRSLLNLQLPDHDSRSLFSDRVLVRDLSGTDYDSQAPRFFPANLAQRELNVAGQLEEIPRENLRLWQPLMDSVEYFEHAKFYPIAGHFLDDQRTQFEISVGFYALARRDAGKPASVEGYLKVVWNRPPSSPIDQLESWRINEWKTSSLQMQESKALLFDEVLDSVLPPSVLAEARRSRHEELVLNFLLGNEDGTRSKPHEFFSIPAFDRHPGIAVVDIDNDGFDDIYLMSRWGPTMLLHNNGDGTFDERAAQYGLVLNDFNSAAIFADFDNDGDSDVFIGRTLARSVYLKNDNGRFVDRSGDIDVPLPFFASSLAAADYDGDGLLDIYISTYASDMIRHQGHDAYSRYLPESDTEHLSALLESGESHENLNRPGPPNLLLRNTGSGFIAEKSTPELRLFLNTYQSTWADYDNDGDPDLYVANDFASNVLFRNDGAGNFSNVTEVSNTADIGFGMGATWGDYDQDGRQDLYVSNMYSKAGQRITAQIPGIDPRIVKMAGGNSLLRNTEDTFEHVSGMASPAITVERAGWSWGSQFADINNDGALDIFALSGYYTAPGEAEIPVDT
ncbi:MAG: FG-GAP repeat domain-containing protein [Halioglobus sp.]